MKKYGKYFLFILTGVLTFSCTTARQSNVELFFIEKGKLQYFFPGQPWLSPDNKEVNLFADWLFRTYALEGEPECRTILNFTLESKDTLFLHGQKIEALYLTNGETTACPVYDASLLFAKQNEIRYTSWLPSRDFNKWMLSVTEPGIQIQFSNQSIYFFATGRHFPEHLDYFRAIHPELPQESPEN